MLTIVALTFVMEYLPALPGHMSSPLSWSWFMVFDYLPLVFGFKHQTRNLHKLFWQRTL
jgi:hypothetical protein